MALPAALDVWWSRFSSDPMGVLGGLAATKPF